MAFPKGEQIGKKVRSLHASYFQLPSQCLDIPMKHCLSCLIYYIELHMCRIRCIHHVETKRKEKTLEQISSRSGLLERERERRVRKDPASVCEMIKRFPVNYFSYSGGVPGNRCTALPWRYVFLVYQQTNYQFTN